MLGDILVGRTQSLNWAYMLVLLVLFFIWNTGLHSLGLARHVVLLLTCYRDNLSKSLTKPLFIFLITISIGRTHSFGLPPAYKILVKWLFLFGLALSIRRYQCIYVWLNSTAMYSTRANYLCLFLDFCLSTLNSLSFVFYGYSWTF